MNELIFFALGVLFGFVGCWVTVAIGYIKPRKELVEFRNEVANRLNRLEDMIRGGMNASSNS